MCGGRPRGGTACACCRQRSMREAKGTMCHESSGAPGRGHAAMPRVERAARAACKIEFTNQAGNGRCAGQRAQCHAKSREGCVGGRGYSALYQESQSVRGKGCDGMPKAACKEEGTVPCQESRRAGCMGGRGHGAMLKSELVCRSRTRVWRLCALCCVRTRSGSVCRGVALLVC
jgi:hypothetical protein